MYANQFLTYQQPAFQGRSVEHTIVADSVEYAQDSFVDAKERLLDVKNWQKYCDRAGVSFILRDGHGREANRRARKGDHINILVNGNPGQCCEINALEYDDYPDLAMETFTMRIKSCIHNEEADDSDEECIAEGALIIERRGRHVYATFYKREMDMAGGDHSESFGLANATWDQILTKFVD